MQKQLVLLYYLSQLCEHLHLSILRGVMLIQKVKVATILNTDMPKSVLPIC